MSMSDEERELYDLEDSLRYATATMDLQEETIGILENENERLRRALGEIKDRDYRGHRCPCAGIARAALDVGDE